MNKNKEKFMTASKYSNQPTGKRMLIRQNNDSQYVDCLNGDRCKNYRKSGCLIKYGFGNLESCGELTKDELIKELVKAIDNYLKYDCIDYGVKECSNTNCYTCNNNRFKQLFEKAKEVIE